MNTPYARYLSAPALPAATADFVAALALEPELRALRDTTAPRAGRTWSASQELGHLVDSALNNHQRFVRAQIPAHLDNGELHFPGYAQDDWVRVGDYAHLDWNDLVTLWVALNHQVLRVMSQVSSEALQRPCFVGGGDSITLEAMMMDYVGHLKYHLGNVLGRGGQA